jgi:hypothetical protein
VKIDVEGAEYEVLLGISDKDWDLIDQFVIETSTNERVVTIAPQLQPQPQRKTSTPDRRIALSCFADNVDCHSSKAVMPGIALIATSQEEETRLDLLVISLLRSRGFEVHADAVQVSCGVATNNVMVYATRKYNF